MRVFLTSFPWIGSLLWLLLCAVFCWNQSPLVSSILLAGAGGLGGSTGAYLLRNARFRLSRFWAFGLSLMLAGSLLTSLLRWLALPSLLLGGRLTYVICDGAFWFWESLVLVFLLRWTSTTRPSLVTLELLFAGGGLIELFAAHRHGFVNRPYALVDPLWARGIDPLPVFLAFGAGIAVLILMLGATHSPKRGRWIDITVLVMLVGGLFLFAPLDKLKELPEEPNLVEPAEDHVGGGGTASGQYREPASLPEGSGGTDNVKSGSQEGPEGQGKESGQDGDEQTSGLREGTGEGGQAEGKSGQSSGQSGEVGQGLQSGSSSLGQGSSGISPGQDGQSSTSQGQGGGRRDDGQPGSSSQGQGEEQGGGGQDPGKAPQSKEESPNAGQGGNADELSFRDSKSGASSPPVAVVIFRDDYTPNSGMYYFRQEAFSQYNGTKLVADTTGQYDRDIAANFPGLEPVKPEVPKLDKELFRELDTKVALLTEHTRPFGLVNPTEWQAAANPDTKRFQKAFEVRSLVLDKPLAEVLGRKTGSSEWSDETWSHYTAAPEDPRYSELLEQILDEYPAAKREDPILRALMVKLWLEREGVYSLQSRHEASNDPTADFLFGDRTGYCVYFAHAAVYLYRTAGMPARTGSGYAVDASQRGKGSSLLIPARSAHSWPEVYIEGMGWVVLDISPEKSLDPPPPPADDGLQQMLGEMARQDPEQENPDPIEDRIDVQQLLQNIVSMIAAAIPYAVMALLIAMYLWKFYRRYEPHVCPEQALPDATLRSLLDLLADAGWVRKEGEPRASFARRVQQVTPSFYHLTQAHLGCRLGDPKKQPNFPWKKTFLEARAEIKNNMNKKDHLRGLLNPISWMKVH